MKYLITIFLLLLLVSCGSTNNIDTNENEDAYKIVTTTFASYDWVKELTKNYDGNIEINYLLDNGIDLHSFQPTVDDVVEINECDLFIYTGGESEAWAMDIINNEGSNDSRIELNLLDIIGENALDEEIVEGMEADHEDEHNEEAHNEEAHNEDVKDEHIWLSLKNAEIVITELCEIFKEYDASNEKLFNENLTAYINELNILDEKYETMVNNSKNDTLIFGDRFPFRYLVEDYDLNYYAAFVGCSAETEASFETVIFLAEKLNELNINYILTVDEGEKKLAKTIVNSSNNSECELLNLNSMQNIVSLDLNSDISYLNIMENNYSVIEKALN
ncbi:MAG: metal ABC transporter substrate-binding protein [Lachnospirales bacterium]